MLKRSKLAASILGTVIALWVSGSHVAEAGCKPVNGHFQEHVVACEAPLCTEGSLVGSIHGDYNFTLTGLFASANPDVSFFTGDSVITTRRGALSLFEAGALQNASGTVADLMSIVGGTGDLAGASGHLVLDGRFDFETGTGEGTYRGELCTP